MPFYYLVSDDVSNARDYHDMALKEQILSDLKMMAAAVLCGRRLEIKVATDGKRFDTFPSCTSACKEHCRYQNTKYMGEIYPGGYTVYANSVIGLYCQVIALMAGDEIIRPFTQFPELYTGLGGK